MTIQNIKDMGIEISEMEIQYLASEGSENSFAAFASPALAFTGNMPSRRHFLI